MVDAFDDEAACAGIFDLGGDVGLEAVSLPLL